jgi:hypothetical protein
MVPDELYQSKGDVIFVKSADGSPRDPTFDRVLLYTLGNDLTEHGGRIHKGNTPAETMQGLNKLHPGVNPAKMMFEGAEMAEEDDVTEWATRTGSSPTKVTWTLNKPTQKFWCWRPSGVRDMGEEELENRTREEVWRSLQVRNPDLREIGDYRMYEGQREVNWSDLPIADLTLVPTVIPVVERGTESHIVNQTTVPRPRNVGRLMHMAFQIFTMEKTPVCEPVEIDAPNEITLAQLVAYFVLPWGRDLDVSTVLYWCPEEIEGKSSSDKTKRTLVQVPYQIPMGLVLRVKANTLGENSTKKMARCKYGSVPMCFAMPEDATIGRLRERVADWMRQRNLGEDWTIEREEREIIDFGFCHEVVSSVREVPINICLKQREIEVMPSESWINVSDRVVRALHLPLGTLFRSYPVTENVQDQDLEDQSYSITWEEGK